METFLVAVVLLAALGFGLYQGFMTEPTPNEALVCPHCQWRGYVTTAAVVRKKGISGGKATGALLTGGVSMLLTGLSRKQLMTHMACGHCGTQWDVA